MKTLYLFQMIEVPHGIIGELVKSHEQPGITKPMTTLVKQMSNGVTAIQLSPFIGAQILSSSLGTGSHSSLR